MHRLNVASAEVDREVLPIDQTVRIADVVSEQELSRFLRRGDGSSDDTDAIVSRLAAYYSVRLVQIALGVMTELAGREKARVKRSPGRKAVLAV